MNKPAEFLIRRWTDGSTIGGITMSELEKKFGYPYVQLDRGDLHRALFERAKECGVQFTTGKKAIPLTLRPVPCIWKEATGGKRT